MIFIFVLWQIKSLVSDLLLGFSIFYGWKSSPIYCRKKMLKIQAQGVVRILWMEFIANRLLDVGRQRCLCSILLHTVRMLAHQVAKVSSNSWSRSQFTGSNESCERCYVSISLLPNSAFSSLLWMFSVNWF